MTVFNPVSASPGALGNPNANAGLLYDCLCECRYGSALVLASGLEKSERADVLFNLAILYGLVGEHERAIEFIDRAKNALKKMSLVKKNFPRPQKYTYARELDIKNKSFLRPIKMDYINEFQDMANDDMLMFGAYNANLKSLNAKRDEYLAGLYGAEFDGLKKELGKV